MKYRDAKKLHYPDEVTRKSDRSVLKVIDVEVYGQHMIVRINCRDVNGQLISLYQDEIE